MNQLGIRSKISFIKIKGHSVKSILKDISLSGSKLIIPSIPDIDVGESCQVAYDFE